MAAKVLLSLVTITMNYKLLCQGISVSRNVHLDPSDHLVFKREIVSTCTNGYETVVNSTMCAEDSWMFTEGSSGIREEEIRKIVDYHNLKRSTVKPSATNMMKMYWDPELARVAEKWAKQCTVGHDKSLYLSRHIPFYGLSPGQNAAFGYVDWDTVLKAWFEESDKYQYGRTPQLYLGENALLEIGHYTQMVTSQSMLIGCGFAKCRFKYGTVFICNYAVGQSDVKTPYTRGRSCEKCPNSCVKGLCDCGNKFCFNGGTLEIDSCQCSCKHPWYGQRCLQTPCPGLSCKNGGKIDKKTCRCICDYPYSGLKCETLQCQVKLDPPHCGTQWPKEYCKYENVNGQCAVMCGLCTAPCSGKICKHGGKLDVNTCMCNCDKLYSGDMCEKKNCPKKDPFYCGTQWPKDYCSKFSNVPTSCPLMCGLCQDPCNGLKCLNGGTTNVNKCSCSCTKAYTGRQCQTERCPKLKCKNGGKVDYSTCSCSCFAPFSGKFCETKNCPNVDPFYCGNQWPKEYCTKFGNVPGACPIMCGICKAPCGKKRCENGGKLNFQTCNCECTDRYTGPVCQFKKCPGLICQNGGSLDIKSCTCSCTKLHSGKYCETRNCPKADPFYCGTQWPKSFCSKYSNVPTSCPIMCGLCKAPCGKMKCQNGGTLHSDSCTCVCPKQYSGTLCQIERCPGLRCQNSGKPNFNTCVCSCEKPFSGSSCQQINCPKSDPFYCGDQWPKEYCQKFSNVPSNCPFMCGIC